MLQSDDVMVPNMKVRKFHIKPQIFEKFAADKVFTNYDETEEESEKDDEDIDYDQVPITRKFKFITCENNSSICSKLWTSLYSTKSHNQIN